MARIRTIKPEFWQDEKLAPCDPITRLVFLGLISMADDSGRVLDNVKVIDAFIFPETSETSRRSLDELSSRGRLRRGKSASGQRIIEIVNFGAHQKIDRPNFRGALPPIVEEATEPQELTEIRRTLDETSSNDRRAVDEDAANHTSYQLPATSYQRPKVRRAASSAPRPEKSWPHFPDDARAKVLEQFRKIGELPAGRVLNAVGPYFRAEQDPNFVAHEHVLLAIADYCGLVSKGRSAPFAGPEDCAKRLGALIANCVNASRHDPLARVDAQMIAIHGQLPRVA